MTNNYDPHNDGFLYDEEVIEIPDDIFENIDPFADITPTPEFLDQSAIAGNNRDYTLVYPTFLVMLDNKPHMAKPDGKEMACIKARLAQECSSPVSVTVNQLADAVKQGKTISPAIIKPTLNDNGKLTHNAKGFVSQQLFCIDIDNANKDHQKLSPEDGYLTIADALKICKDNGIFVALIYETFSSQQDYQKFRVCVVLYDPVTSDEERSHIIQALIGLFGAAADKACTNADRIMHGSTDGCIKLIQPNFRTPKKTILGIWDKTHPVQDMPTHLFPLSIAPVSPVAPAPADSNWSRAYDFDVDRLLDCLDADVAETDWIAYTAAYKGAGGTIDGWEAWSRRSSKWRDSDRKRWAGIHGTNKGTLVNYAKQTPAGQSYMDSMRQAQAAAKQEFAAAHKAPAAPSAPAESKAEDAPKLVIRRASEFADFTPEFIWEPYLPKGEYTILFADSGVGKNIVCCGIAASISAGKPLPGETSREPGTVLFVSSEDDGAHIKSRVADCGGNTDNVYVADRKDTVGLELLGKDMPAIEKIAIEIKPQLIVIDPWQAFVGSSIDVNRINHVRPVMARIALLAEKCGCSIILISHVNKRAQGENANYAASGSAELVNASRSAFTVVYDNNPDYPEDRDSRILVHTKSNKSCLGQSIVFRTTDDKLTWGDFTEIDKSTLEYAAQRRISLYEALDQQHAKREDFSDVVRAIVQIRKSHTEPEVRVTYDDLGIAYQPMGDEIWKKRDKNQRKRIVQGLLNVLRKDHNIAISFLNTPIPKLYDKKSKGRGFAISYINTPVSDNTLPAASDTSEDDFINLDEFELITDE